MVGTWQGWVVWLVLAAPPSEQATATQLQRFEYTQVQMGASFKVVLYAADEKTANSASTAAFARVKQLNDLLSDYDEKSELSRLSATSGNGALSLRERKAEVESGRGQGIKVSDDLWRVLVRSQEVSRDTGGAFDISVGPLVKLWRQSRILKKLPSDERIAEAKKSVGYDAIVLNAGARTATLTKPGMRLDLGGIGVGYAADEALAVLRKQGITRALIDGSGDIAIGDPPPDKPGWRVGIAPLEAKGPPSRYVTLANCAISTSGDAFQFVEIGGRRYSHIVDPQTGLGLTRRSSVTVVASDCTTADAYATGVSVQGPAKGLAVIDRLVGAAALFVVAGEKTETFASKRWSTLAVEEAKSPVQRNRNPKGP